MLSTPPSGLPRTYHAPFGWSFEPGEVLWTINDDRNRSEQDTRSSRHIKASLIRLSYVVSPTYRAAGSTNWLRNPFSPIERWRISGYCDLIRAAYTPSHGISGVLRIFLDLREAGKSCRKHLVARIMWANNIKALHEYQPPGTLEAPCRF